LLREYLKSGPFEIHFAENGQEALDLVQTQTFDLILMDILMPVMDGLTATRLIRRREQEAGMQPVPLLALTANARAEDLELSAAAGCTGHISKPISRQLLIEKVMDQIRIRPVEISIPQGLEEAAKRYLLARRNELATLNQLISQADFDQLRRLAHNMKGTGTSYGFPDLTRIGKSMETAAKAQRAEDLSAQLVELSRYLQDAEAVLTAR
jgi:CheY-like chemotaxis protein